MKNHPDGKFVFDIDISIDINEVTARCRVALRNESSVLLKILPYKVDPLLSLMMVGSVVQDYQVQASKSRSSLSCQ